MDTERIGSEDWAELQRTLKQPFLCTTESIDLRRLDWIKDGGKWFAVAFLKKEKFSR